MRFISIYRASHAYKFSISASAFAWQTNRNRTMFFSYSYFALVLAITLVGCTSSPEILPLASALVPGAAVEEILVATSRQSTDDPLVMYDGNRSPSLNFARIAVSVPPNQQAGKITYPTKNPDPAKQFVALQAETGIDRAEFLSRINMRLQSLPANERTAFVFVHGFNTDFAEGIYRHAQLRHDFDVPGVAVSYSWPSAGQTPLYLYDRDSVEFARRGLVETLQIVAASKARSILLIGHSMGALLTMEALREISLSSKKSILRRLDTLILAAPDIDIDVFGEQIREIDPLPKKFAVFISRKDRALQVSQRLRGGHPRVGEGTDIDDLRHKGIYVLDLSNEGGPFDRINHNTFATSPTLLALAQKRLLARADLTNSSTAGTALTTVGDLLAGIIYLPAKVAGVR